MTQDPELSEEQARELIKRVVGSRQVTMYPFEFGWLARPILSEEEHRQGRGLGLSSYIIDRTGIITVQRSLGVPLVIKQYSAARREGRITGRQVWPPAGQTPPAQETPAPRTAQKDPTRQDPEPSEG